MIPFFNIKSENDAYVKAYAKELSLFLESGQYILGDAVTTFEREFAAFCGTDFCVGTSNGLDALRLIFEGYKSLGILAEGDEVLVPAHTYIATVLAVTQAGLTPVFVEPKDGSFDMDVKEAHGMSLRCRKLLSRSVNSCLIFLSSSITIITSIISYSIQLLSSIYSFFLTTSFICIK